MSTVSFTSCCRALYPLFLSTNQHLSLSCLLVCLRSWVFSSQFCVSSSDAMLGVFPCVAVLSLSTCVFLCFPPSAPTFCWCQVWLTLSFCWSLGFIISSLSSFFCCCCRRDVFWIWFLCFAHPHGFCIENSFWHVLTWNACYKPQLRLCFTYLQGEEREMRCSRKTRR